MSTIETYRHSGRIDAMTIPVGLVGGLVISVAMAWVYQLAVDWIPLIYVSVLCTLGFGFGFGFAMTFLLQKLNCRNRFVAGLLTLILAGVGLAASFGFAYLRTVGELAKENKMTTQEVREQYGFQRYITKRVEAGWNIGSHGRTNGSAMSGIMVWLIWLIEALIVIVGAVVVTVGALTDPFCEECHDWLAKRVVGFRNSVPLEKLNAAVSEGTLAEVLAVEGGDAATPGVMEYSVYSCEGCSQKHYLSLTHKYSVTNSKGQQEAKSDTILQHAETDQSTLSRLESALKQQAPVEETAEA
jgi:hypothetical protein